MSVINLYNGDCMEGMKNTPDEYYDLAICDPPYGIGEDGGKIRHGEKSKAKGFSKKSYENKNWDTKPGEDYFKELFRVSKNQIIWGGNFFIDHLKPTPCFLIWDKKGTDKSDFADCEIAWASFASAIRIFKYDWVGFGNLNLPEKRNRFHPTQKPVALYKWVLKNYAKPGDKILDTHLGSASHAIACHDMGFDLDAWELDEDYYKAGKERFEKHCRQAQLFSPQQVVNFKQEGLL